MMTFHRAEDIAEIVKRLGKEARALSGRSVLLVGGNGFLGRCFTSVFLRLNECVLDEPCRLIVLDNLMIPSGESRARRETPRCRFVRHDIIQPFISSEQIDIVIHAAGIASPYYYRKYPLQTLEVATIGTRNLLQLASEHQARFLFFSSSEIYGDPDPRSVPTPEHYRGNVSCLGPRACYDESKRLGETLTQIFHETSGLHTNVVRPFNVYGPGMSPTDYRVLPNFANCIVNGMPLQIYGSGRQTRTFCYLTDAMTGFIQVLLRGLPGEVYNIGSSRPEVTVFELVRFVEEVLGRRVPALQIKYPEAYPGDEPNRRCPDISKAAAHLGYQPRVALSEGLHRFFEWAQAAYPRANSRAA
jgi:UDP-glucuronate decarboxylase